MSDKPAITPAQSTPHPADMVPRTESAPRPTTKPAPDAAAAGQGGAPVAAVATPAGGNRRRRMIVIGGAAAIVLILGGGTWFLLRHRGGNAAGHEAAAEPTPAAPAEGAAAEAGHEGSSGEASAAAQEGHAEQGQQAPGAPRSTKPEGALEVTEYLALAEAAVAERRYEDARKLAGRILPLLPKGQMELRWRYDRVVAVTGAPAGAEEAGGAKRDLAHLTPIERLAGADADFDAGRMADAREKYLMFLLRAGDLGKDGDKLISWAHGRLSLAMAALWRARAGEAEIPEPPVLFEGVDK